MFRIIFLCLICYGLYVISVKKEKDLFAKIIFILYLMLTIFIFVLYALDIYNTSKYFNPNGTLNIQSWLVFGQNLFISLTTEIISALVLISVTMYQIKKNETDSIKRDNENFRIQNMPLLKYRCSSNEHTNTPLSKILNTKDVKSGQMQEINFILKNIGLNTIRKLNMTIKSNILDREYEFEVGEQTSIEKNEEKIITLILNLEKNSTYDFEIIVYYQDLLCNWYHQNIKLNYSLDNANKCNHKIYVDNEKLINRNPF